MFNLFRKSKDLQKENEDLKARLEECKSKLDEKQEHINKTNAFWKKKLAEASKPSKKSTKDKS